MKILDLHLLAYGPFTDRTLDLSDGREGLHLVYGANEAGKSSALRALRALLYGVPERTQDDFRHARTELRVGGRLRGAAGDELRCYRRKGRKNTLLDAEGSPLAEDRLQQLLGGVAEPLFERLFGIDHQALVSGGQALLVERGREAEALFGTGLGSTSVHALLASFEQEAQSLFAPRASKPALNAGLSQLSELKHQQRELSLSARHWDEARQAVDEAIGRLTEIDRELAEAARRRNTLERIRRALPGLAKRRHLREQLGGLGEVPSLEEDVGQRREAASTKRRVALEGRSKAEGRLKGLRADAASLQISPELLAESEGIDELRDRLGGYLKASRDRPGLLERRSTLIEQARQRFAEIRADLAFDEVEQLRPMLGRRRRATELGGRREALESAVKQAAESLEAAADKLNQKQGQLNGLAAPIADDALRQAVSEARRAGDLDRAVAEATARSAQHQAVCERELQALGLWRGNLAALACVAVPNAQTLARYSDQFQALEDEARRLNASIADLHKEQRQTESALQALRLAGEVPTERQLQHARARRDLGWQLLKRQWIDQEDISAEAEAYDREAPLPEAFEQGIAIADEVADRLRRESQRVHEQATAQARLEQCRQLNADALAALQRIEQQRQELEASWQALWTDMDLAPLPPREMSAWVEQLLRLREKTGQGEELRETANALALNRDAQRQHLLRALTVCGQPQPQPQNEPPTPTLRPMLEHAESCLSAIERSASLRAGLEKDVAELEETTRLLGREFARTEKALAAWTSEWALLMRELGLDDQTTPGEVSDHLQSIADGLRLVDDAKQIEIRIQAIEREAEDFERDVQALLLRLAPNLSGRPVDEAMHQLSSHLTEQRTAKSRLDELNKQLRQAEKEARDAEAELHAADAVLGELCRQAGCDSVDQLEVIERRFFERRALTEELREVERELIDSGDGLSLEGLETEAAEVDRDQVLAEITALDQRIDRELNPQRGVIFEQKLVAEQQFQAMAGSDEASALAEQAQQTLSEVRAHAERYIRLRLAARLLRDEIEAFRRKHRDPILTQASRYFSKLTCASLSGVETDFDESDQPVLVGVRPNGERLRVEAMSTGTRDQLYLALRLAALDHYAESAEPLPLIVDDILIQFDDDRSRATLDALAEFSCKTQVILFTHHERVAEEARGVERASERVFVHALA
ncbi:AAA family ATPase [Lamprobacter modestohalophilus]|uniref:ATP-binding protein n=1 Tax=Lamprobacter modestohalophilus TaxID=1064514 RepID=UPI002ADEEFAF|nr:AAA family ATPase [Lamprobacter modestohalophilus]MEA1050425.1 AAA family ATPase [Lamprobacter modestohalophilus]